MNGIFFGNAGLFLAIAGIIHSLTLFGIALMRIFREESDRARRRREK